MAFPTQRPPNLPPNQMNQMRPNPLQRTPVHPMFSNRPMIGQQPQSRNPMQNIIGRLFQSKTAQQGSLPTRTAGGLSGTLNNVQQVLKIAQSAAPMVQQYGPMVKNIPTMFKMLKAFKDIDNETDGDVETDSPSTEQPHVTTQNESNNSTEQTKTANQNRGESKPKLFI
ncbi:VrrA/YqfQ family protein [Virgibacillus sp. FSP13]